MKTQAKLILTCLALLMVTQVHAMRWYSPSTGSWFSRDPIGEPGFRMLLKAGTFSLPRVASPQSTGWRISRDSAVLGDEGNLYCFVKNAPLDKVDFLGLEPWPGYPGGPWGPGLGCFTCKCRSVQVSYEPGGNSLALGPYGGWLDRRFGNQVHVRWNVDGGAPWLCKYYQDEKGTLLTLQSGGRTVDTVVGEDGHRAPQVYTDYMGWSFGSDMSGSWTMIAHWNVTFRCESAPGSGGGTVTKHDTSDVQSTFTVPWW
jgi:hypothetical protein